MQGSVLEVQYYIFMLGGLLISSSDQSIVIKTRPGTAHLDWVHPANEKLGARSLWGERGDALLEFKELYERRCGVFDKLGASVESLVTSGGTP